MTASDRSLPSRANDLRQADRLPILGALQGEVMVFQPMTITEIGGGGVQVDTAFPFQIDSLHDLRLELGSHTVIVKGRVVHCRVADMDQEIVRYQSGLQFVDLPTHAATAIDTFIERVKRERGA
jgi:hypothetical protein